MSNNLEDLRNDLKNQLLEKLKQASVDNFKMFDAYLKFEQQVLLSSCSDVVLYDPQHAEISQRDIYRKIIECTKIEVIDTTGPDGEINSTIRVTADGLDLSNPYVMDSFTKMLNSVSTRMQYKIRS